MFVCLFNSNGNILCFTYRFHGSMLACVLAVFVGTMKTTGAIQLTTCTGKQIAVYVFLL